MSEQNITPFLFEGESLVRVVMLDAEPWFIAADVCRCLGIKNPASAVAALDADERNTLTLTDGIPGNPTKNIITEGGLYTLIVRSRKAMEPGTVQHRFRKWVTSEVLPTLRKVGSYSIGIPKGDQSADNEETEAAKLRFVTETRLTWGERSAQQMWLRKGLLTVPAMLEVAQLPLPFASEG
ncbi:Prophage antirepressor (fragment) [uncultured Alphaproteobacteria bacterium]|uniref:Prophage antirepressor n=1 Tax=uncultured Alphaproteobacteria bacterium TaxID=91750 RepID=A0A212KM93_9PROT